MSGILSGRAAKPVVFTLALCPLLWLIWLAFSGGAGVNPIEFINRYLGDWAMRMLLITLALTPLRLLTGRGEVLRYRRMLGLFAFSYAVLHINSYVILDHFFNWTEIGKDIVKRNYITVGMIALTLLIPLAVTSTNKMVKRLGGRAWTRLHRLVYVIGGLVIVHFYMMVKADVREPLAYGAILALLLLVRLAFALKRRLRQRQPKAAVLSSR